MRIWLLLAIQAAAYAGLAVEHLIFGTLTHGQLPLTLSLIGVAVIAYGLTIWQTEKAGGLSLSTLLLGAILFRVLLLLTQPTLSSDIYRYLWDGYVANNGVSPYAFPIDSAQLDYLTHPIRSQANHTWMASPYLPAAQWLFGRVTAWLPINALSIQITMVLVDLLSGALIMAILGMVGLPKYRALIYLWNPLVVVEIAQGAHIDGWMIFLTMVAIWFALRYGDPSKPQQSPSSGERAKEGEGEDEAIQLSTSGSIITPAKPGGHSAKMDSCEGRNDMLSPNLMASRGEGTFPLREMVRRCLFALAPLFLAFATPNQNPPRLSYRRSVLAVALVAALFLWWRCGWNS